MPGCWYRVPLQYLTGAAHWRDLVLAVGPGVLIPRPETELLIDFAEEVCPGQMAYPSIHSSPECSLLHLLMCHQLSAEHPAGSRTQVASKPTERCMQAMKSQNRPPDGPWADLGSGSGALAIALARALPKGTQVMLWSQIETAKVCPPLQMKAS